MFCYRDIWDSGLLGKLGGLCCLMVRHSLAIQKFAGSISAGSLPGNNFEQVVHTYVPLSPSTITMYRPMGGELE